MDKIPFDREAVYDEHIAPLMTKIIEACKEHGIPMFCTFHYGTDDAEEHFCTSMLATEPYASGALKKCERIVYAGYDVVPPQPLIAFTVTKG